MNYKLRKFLSVVSTFMIFSSNYANKTFNNSVSACSANKKKIIVGSGIAVASTAFVVAVSVLGVKLAEEDRIWKTKRIRNTRGTEESKRRRNK